MLPDEALPLVVFAFQMEMLEEENLCTLRRTAIFFPARVRTRSGQSLTKGSPKGGRDVPKECDPAWNQH